MRFDEHFSLFKAKIHFWSLNFGSILILVPKLILHLDQSLKLESRFYFSPYHQPSNRKCICGKQSALLACYMLMWLIK